MTTTTASGHFWADDDRPFQRLLRRLHLSRPTGNVRRAWLVAIAWVPLALGAVIRKLGGREPEPLVYDISVHIRFLVAMPCVLTAEHMLRRLVNTSVAQLYDGRFADASALDRVLDRAERLRAEPAIELALAGCALVLGQLVLWGVVGTTGLVSGTSQTSWSISGVWYAAIALPLLQFLVLRWIWEWIVWSLALVQISRMRLATAASHPDRSAGLEFLSWPLGAFAMFMLGLSCVLAGAWGTQLLAHRTTIPSLVPTLAILLAIALVVALGPLILFAQHLYRARLAELSDYNALALQYVREFRAKWIDAVPITSPLGAADIQALHDLGGAYEVIATTGMTVFRRRSAIAIVLAVLVPLIPLALTVVPIQRVFSRLVDAVVGALAL
ncbi:MAG TPA: hypothetical protein VMJ10_30550 [Kofleriaceae bacterium]|nr:hypothetical protein [Kofleriaceae bacterium]